MIAAELRLIKTRPTSFYEKYNLLQEHAFLSFRKFSCLKRSNTVIFNFSVLQYKIMELTGITCKKIPCYMRDSACRWFIVKKAEIFRSYVKHF